MLPASPKCYQTEESLKTNKHIPITIVVAQYSAYYSLLGELKIQIITVKPVD